MSTLNINDILKTMHELKDDDDDSQHEATLRSNHNFDEDEDDSDPVGDMLPDAAIKKIAELQEETDDLDSDKKVQKQINIIKKIPYFRYAKHNTDFINIEQELNTSHFGMNETKLLIIESLQAALLRGETKFPYLCLYGSPGVGKTTLLKNVAKVLDVPIYFINVAGKQAMQIIGCEPTYKSANIGLIIQGLIETRCMNPIFVFDEIDKVASDDRYGCISDVILSICDPAQNTEFRDQFINFDVDLSKAAFFFTANNPTKIPEALRSRLTMIEIKDYSIAEKIAISKSFIIPQQIEEFKLNSEIELTEEALSYLVKSCEIDDVTLTRSGGVRNITKYCERMLIKASVEINRNKLEKLTITKDWIVEHIGISKIEQIRNQIKQKTHKAQNIDRIGTIHSLAVIGDDLSGVVDNVTCRIIPGGNGNITFTGKMLDGPRDAALTAYHFIRSNCQLLGISVEILTKNDFVIHSHNAATAKDGTSAGIVYLMALLSEITERPISDDIAMTGQLDLDGSITAVGGIDLKVDASIISGLSCVYLSTENIEDVLPEQNSQINLIFVPNAFELISMLFPKYKWHCENCGEILIKTRQTNKTIWRHSNDRKCTWQSSYFGNNYPQHLIKGDK